MLYRWYSTCQVENQLVKNLIPPLDYAVWLTVFTLVPISQVNSLLNTARMILIRVQLIPEK